MAPLTRDQIQLLQGTLRARRDQIEAAGADPARLDALTYAINALGGTAPRTRRPLREAQMLSQAALQLSDDDAHEARTTLDAMAESAWDEAARQVGETGEITTPLDRELAEATMRTLSGTGPSWLRLSWPPTHLNGYSADKLAARTGGEASALEQELGARGMHAARRLDADFSLFHDAWSLAQGTDVDPRHAEALTAMADDAVETMRADLRPGATRRLARSATPLADLRDYATATAALDDAGAEAAVTARAQQLRDERARQVAREFWAIIDTQTTEVDLADELARHAERTPGQPLSAALGLDEPARAEVIDLLLAERPEIVDELGPEGAAEAVSAHIRTMWARINQEITSPDPQPTADPDPQPTADVHAQPTVDLGPTPEPSAHSAGAASSPPRAAAEAPGFVRPTVRGLMRDWFDRKTLGDQRRAAWHTLRGALAGDPLGRRAEIALRGVGIVGGGLLGGLGGAVAGGVAAEWYIRRQRAHQSGELVRSGDERLAHPDIDPDARAALSERIDQRLYQEASARTLAALAPEQRREFRTRSAELERLTGRLDSPLAERLGRLRHGGREHVRHRAEQQALQAQADALNDELAPILSQIESAYVERRARFNEEFARRFGLTEPALAPTSAGPAWSM